MKQNRKGFTLVEILIVLAVIGLIVSIAVPAFLKNRHHSQGREANETLKQIYRAKERIFSKRVPSPGEAAAVSNGTIEVQLLDMNIDGIDVDAGSLDGGTYAVGTLVDASGVIVIPTCSSELKDSDGDGVTNGQEGLFIHLPAFIQNQKTGLYHRDQRYTFADEAPNGS